MSLVASHAGGPTPPIKGTPCSVGKLVRSLPPDERAALLAMFDDEDWTSEAIARELATEVHVFIQGQTIARHRREGCHCVPR